MPEIIAQREFLPAYMLFDTIFLLGGIRSAAITAWDDKLITLLVNSLLETNLGMPYVYVLYLLYSSRFTEQLKKRPEKTGFLQALEIRLPQSHWLYTVD